MQRTVTLTASARYGYGGKQYIAKIIGRDPKFTFQRDFVGRKGGKRNEDAEHQTDEPGLYVTCDIDRKGGRDETYVVVYDLPGFGITTCNVSREDAMELARDLPTDWTGWRLRQRLDASVKEPREKLVAIKVAQLGFDVGEVARDVWEAALRRELGEVPPEITGPDLSKTRQPGPLDAFGTADLIAELRRRGVTSL